MKPIEVCGWQIVEKDGCFWRKDSSIAVVYSTLYRAVISAQRDPHPRLKYARKANK